jgi:hypothetical protein
MPSFSTTKVKTALEDSIPEAGASLESILCIEELQRRPSRPPDYENERRALVALMSALADSPSTIFQHGNRTLEPAVLRRALAGCGKTSVWD